MAFSTTSLTYIGSFKPLQCKENHVFAILSFATSSNLVCRTLGDALDQLSVLLLLSLPAGGLNVAGILLSDSCFLWLPLTLAGGDFRSLDDLECSSLWLSRWAKALAGVLSA